MNADTQAGRRWAIAGAGAVASAVLVAALFRLPSTPSRAPDGPRRVLQVRQIDDRRTALREEAIMRDLAPLFLPTPRNATPRRPPLREPGRTFLEGEGPKLAIAATGWRFDRDLPALVTLGDKPMRQVTALDVLRSGAEDGGVTGFGRRAGAAPELAQRGGWVEVLRLRDGQPAMRPQPLPAEARPPVDRPWQPLELMASVGATGLNAPLTVSVRSGVDEVDSFFRNYLMHVLRVGDRLEPGFYRIRLAP